MSIVTLAELSVVAPLALYLVAVTPAAHAVSSTLTLDTALALAQRSQGALVFFTHGAVTELTHKSFAATTQQLEQQQQHISKHMTRMVTISIYLFI